LLAFHVANLSVGYGQIFQLFWQAAALVTVQKSL
jgi:hypothetical protein